MYNCIPTYPEYMRTKIGVSSKATDSNSCINSCINPHEDKADEQHALARDGKMIKSKKRRKNCDIWLLTD